MKGKLLSMNSIAEQIALLICEAGISNANAHPDPVARVYGMLLDVSDCVGKHMQDIRQDLPCNGACCSRGKYYAQ